MCTHRYQPCAEFAGKAKSIELLKFQKVLMIRHPFNLEWCSLPTKWMPTMLDDFFARAAELHASALESHEGAQSFVQGGFQHLRSLLETQAILAPLEKYQWMVESEEVMNKAAGFGEQSNARVKEAGFYGALSRSSTRR